MDMEQEAARKAKAERLRNQIEQLKSPSEQAEPTAEKPEIQRENPREFIQRRMREIEAQRRK